jgi:hypothetical protein
VQFQLERDGFELMPALLDPGEISLVERLLDCFAGSAGVRIFGNPALGAWLIEGSLGMTAQSVLGPKARPVRAILFDKKPTRNWAIGWHQDRTIAVRERIPATGFDRWTNKAGVMHVEPPFAIVEKMITVRLHFDPVNGRNAPLLVSPGSHLLGRITEGDVQTVIERCGIVACLADRGDVWLYRTAILHASEKSEGDASRRVLQVDFSCEDLPGRLEWVGVA